LDIVSEIKFIRLSFIDDSKKTKIRQIIEIMIVLKKKSKIKLINSMGSGDERGLSTPFKRFCAKKDFFYLEKINPK